MIGVKILKKKLNSFIKKDGIKINNKLRRTKFKSNGAQQVVNIISKKLKNF